MNGVVDVKRDKEYKVSASKMTVVDAASSASAAVAAAAFLRVLLGRFDLVSAVTDLLTWRAALRPISSLKAAN